MARARAVIAAAWWGVLLCGCGDDAAAADAGAAPAIDGSTADAGPELRATTATGAARDLGALIDATRGAADRVFVHGGSYGTYWAQRYLQLFPDQPDAVVLDGLVFPSISPNWLGYDEDHDRLGRDLLALCDRDPDCSAHLTPDAETFMTTLRDADMPPCPDALDPDVPLSLLASQLMKLRSGQMYLFPLLYRASRCSAEDQMVIPRITALRSVLVDPGSSLAAFVHIALQLGLQSSAAEAEGFA